MKILSTPILTRLMAQLITASLVLSACGGTNNKEAPIKNTVIPNEETTPPVDETETTSPETEIIPSTLTKIDNFGENPTNLDMHLYVPQNLANAAPILLAVHYCTGDGPTFYGHTRYAQLADKHGFIVIYPSAIRSTKCFDVYSQQALTRDGGSDPVALRSMINYVQSHYNVDEQRIFITGVSSGAMTTNVMLALYPDVFAAGSAFAGVPYTCFATTGGSEWNSQCSGGQISKTATQWGDIVRSANPDFSGPYPRIQLWHGTEDEALHYNNFVEAIKQWTNMHGLSQTPDFTDTPSTGVTHTRYGSSGEEAAIEAFSLEGVGHNLPLDEDAVIGFFGLDNS